MRATDLGRVVRAIREEDGLRREDLARKIDYTARTRLGLTRGLALHTLGDIEHGRHQFTSVLLALLDELGLEIVQTLRERDRDD